MTPILRRIVDPSAVVRCRSCRHYAGPGIYFTCHHTTLFIEGDHPAYSGNCHVLLTLRTRLPVVHVLHTCNSCIALILDYQKKTATIKQVSVRFVCPTFMICQHVLDVAFGVVLRSAEASTNTILVFQR